jgi:hypothetical protein
MPNSFQMDLYNFSLINPILRTRTETINPNIKSISTNTNATIANLVTGAKMLTIELALTVNSFPVFNSLYGILI